MRATTLSHTECVRLARSPDRYRPALASFDGAEPIPLLCLVLGDGDLLVPAGQDPSLVRMAAGRTVSVTVADRDTGGGWVVTGVGLARPLTPADRAGLPVTEDFGTGIRIAMARMTGRSTAPEPEVPRPRLPD
ncbi:hypothetical protein [Amycolatopsis alkalitolerans]|uniref:Pyridoxamine 5'-phosphate oxidase family protein n=1 Tax=Amycolatopsis alkalitolerans TaxID=2547244 RepID=A0A5C4M2V3_9PSEU|nr:hypothetical protein [Amycolatopsis alkalitolerans]TNC24182.1 hypothetical protein FG385_19205 [Amycolatopsis alkalitolerans]